MDYLDILKSYIKRFMFLLRKRDYDLFFIEKELFPYIPFSFERLVLKRTRPFIADYDDAIFHNYDQHRWGLVRKVLSNKIPDVMRMADMISSGNRYISQYALERGARNVTALPTVIDLDKYSYIQKPADTGTFCIGWIGSPATTRYLVLIIPVLRELKEKMDFKLILVGADPSISNELEGIHADIHPWDEDTEIGLISSFHVGVMPLENTVWAKGKSGFKLIQYMASGKPVIASPVGENETIVRPGFNGFLAESSEEWSHYLLKLASDPELITEMGKNGRRQVEQDYSLQVVGHRLLGMIKAIKDPSIKSTPLQYPPKVQ